MDQIHDIRNRFFEKGENISRIADELHLDRKTVRKYVDMTDFNAPSPKPASEQRFCPKLDPYKLVIDEWLEVINPHRASNVIPLSVYTTVLEKRWMALTVPTV